MPGLAFAPTLEHSLVRERAFVTVDRVEAGWSCEGCPEQKPCDGFMPGDLPLIARALTKCLIDEGKQFLFLLAKRGYQLHGDLAVHGPWISLQLNKHLADVDSPQWQKARDENDPSHILPFVFERTPEDRKSDYLIVGEFVVQNTLHDLEA